MLTTTRPLRWPEHMARTRNLQRGTFKALKDDALRNVEWSLNSMARDSGKPIAGVRITSDGCAVALWFDWDGMTICIPVDRYTTERSNLQAVHHILEARRSEMRHGTPAVARASFVGLAALPPPMEWWTVLRVQPDASPDIIEAAFRALARRYHPDVGGSQADMARLVNARDDGLKAARES